MGQRQKVVDLSKLTPEQREALGSFYRDCQAAAPHVGEMQQAAKAIFEQFVKAPRWAVTEGQRPDQVTEDLWHVKPEINYVDHIEGAP